MKFGISVAHISKNIGLQICNMIIAVAIMLIDRWYQGFDWEGLRVQSSTPPIVPKVFSEIFTRHVTVSRVKTVD